MKPQLFFECALESRAWAGLLMFASLLTACGQVEEQEQGRAQADPITIFEGKPSLGTSLAAGGAVGTGSVWAATSPSEGAAARQIVRCEVQLDRADPAVSCDAFCSGDQCPLPVSRSAHLWKPTDVEEHHCFALGVDPSKDGAIKLVCEDEEIALPLLEDNGKVVSAAVGPWKLGIDGGVSPTLAVASPDTGVVWYYPAASTEPMQLAPRDGGMPAGYAWDVAVLRLGIDRYNSRLIAVSALDAGQVWLFRSGFPTPEYPLAAGCLGNRPGFGRVLASGDVDGDSLTDLIVADDTFVTVFSGTSLALVGEQAELGCGLASLPEDAILASVSCASGGLTGGCEQAAFGASIVVADLDGDADGELIIGAPGMKVAGKRSGAVLIYDAEGESHHELTETVVDRRLPDGARFGASIGVVNAKDIDALAIGAPGTGSLHLASCFSMTRSELRPKRCAGLDL